ncbi:DUF3857 domain-containing protein [Pareuzebyella sediminis]|uniref:DUF3857 domain-containing protein n=1 Tax=Pareuzebyella sediminis TaxID=2607998 RepID=UPI0011F00153|nr:DUF3857 domain-containing protein [Pareuzebyella sediminis]
MISTKKLPLLLAFISVQTLWCQEIQFGEVSKEELLEKEYALDPDAPAAVLYRYQNTYMQSNNGYPRLITEIHERIKVYNKAGFEYATEQINLYNGRSDKESVRKIKGYTYNLEQDKIVKSELDKDQIFESELSFNYDQVKFTMPNVKEGSVIEFEYYVSSPFYWLIDEFRFQKDIPVKQVRAELRTPKGYNFRQTQKGYVPFTSQENIKRDNRIGMDVVVTSFDLRNVPALKAESYVDNIHNYRAGALFELVSIDLPGYPTKSFAHSWGDVAKSIGNTDDYKNQLDKTRSFDDELDAILSGKTDKLEITNILFKYVKDNTEWNGMDGKSFQHGLKKTIKEKKGNAADINLLLVAMLRYAGIHANPVILSTKENAIPFFPTLDRLNFVIAHAKIDGEDYYMDATEEFSDVNLLPIRDYNWGGLLVDNENMVWKHIFNIAPQKAESMYSVKMEVDQEGIVSGNYRSRFTNHAAYRFRESLKNQDLENYLRDKESKYTGMEISEYEAKNVDSYEGHVSESFHYRQENGADVINDKIYLQPLSFLKIEENPFKLDKREYPIDYGFPFRERYMVNIKLPEGYQVESLPSAAIIKLPDNLGIYKYAVQNAANGIQLSVTFEVNKAVIAAINYPYIKEYYNQIIIKGAEQIVLSKTDNEYNESTAGSR